jgi:hypothetical protein
MAAIFKKAFKKLQLLLKSILKVAATKSILKVAATLKKASKKSHLLLKKPYEERVLSFIRLYCSTVRTPCHQMAIDKGADLTLMIY